VYCCWIKYSQACAKAAGYDLRHARRLVDAPSPAVATDNTIALNDQDLDVGSSGVTLIPDNTLTALPKLLAVCGKDGTCYVINRDDMGRFNAVSDDVVFKTQLRKAVGNTRILQGLAFFNSSAGPFLYQVCLGGGLGGSGTLRAYCLV
jgi:hypothetical protein